ncbi:MAG: peptide-methionine (S)-S-oxide reductase MsrA [Gammaproteobacteria bacterium]|nr:peptide-methionine (S)-S-oxide reductase MsrA [Gammaproteobacteria bacterium]
MQVLKLFAGKPLVVAVIAGGLLLVVIAVAGGRGEEGTLAAGEPSGELAVATFAGGCFWCMEPPFDVVDGVISTTSGYTGGHVDDPTYHQVSSGSTGHAEAVRIIYDPKRVNYEDLLKIFWHNIDPTKADRQFCDRGSQYRPAIFYHGEAQRDAALASLAQIEKTKPFKDPIRTEIVAATEFFVAEDYHQDFYVTNPIRYKHYRFGCGRDRRLNQIWGGES